MVLLDVSVVPLTRYPSEWLLSSSGLEFEDEVEIGPFSASFCSLSPGKSTPGCGVDVERRKNDPKTMIQMDRCGMSPMSAMDGKRCVVAARSDPRW